MSSSLLPWGTRSTGLSEKDASWIWRELGLRQVVYCCGPEGTWHLSHELTVLLIHRSLWSVPPWIPQASVILMYARVICYLQNDQFVWCPESLMCEESQSCGLWPEVSWVECIWSEHLFFLDTSLKISYEWKFFQCRPVSGCWEELETEVVLVAPGVWLQKPWILRGRREKWQ